MCALDDMWMLCVDVVSGQAHGRLNNWSFSGQEQRGNKCLLVWLR